MRTPGTSGFDLLNGETGGPPYIQYCNDPRGTRLKANTQLTDGGWLRITAARVPPFDLEKTMEENVASELRWEYGGRLLGLARGAPLTPSRTRTHTPSTLTFTHAGLTLHTSSGGNTGRLLGGGTGRAPPRA